MNISADRWNSFALRQIGNDSSELEAISALLRGGFATGTGGSPYAKADAEMVSRKLAEGRGFVIGPPKDPLACVFARPSRDWPGAWYLGALCVATEARGAGLARRLEAAVEAEARRRGHLSIALDTWADPTSPRPLFETWGYRAVREADGVVAMLRPLAAPRRLLPGNPGLAEVLPLLHHTFAGMEGRIDPPSSLHRLDLVTLTDQATTGEVWGLGDPLDAVAVFTVQRDALYLGKIASRRPGRGHARALIGAAEARARALGLPRLRLQTRVELVENHATFAALGFAKVGETAHVGYDRPTSLTYERETG